MVVAILVTVDLTCTVASVFQQINLKQKWDTQGQPGPL